MDDRIKEAVGGAIFVGSLLLAFGALGLWWNRYFNIRLRPVYEECEALVNAMIGSSPVDPEQHEAMVSTCVKMKLEEMKQNK